MRIQALLLAVLLVTVPGTALAQSDGGNDATDRSTEDITFYGHVFGAGMGGEGAAPGPMPANTEFPAGEAIFGSGEFHWCTEDASANLAGQVEQDGCRTDEENTLALFSTPGKVDISNSEEFDQGGGYAQLHNERGQTKDVVLGDGNVEATIYVTVDRHGWAIGNAYGTNCIYPHPTNVPCVYPYWGWDVGAQPDFTVEATVYQANLGERTNSSTQPPVAEAIESGDAEIVAQGSSKRSMAMNGLPGSPKALEYNIDLGQPQVDKIDKENDFFTTYRFYSESSGQAYSDASWRVWSGEFFPPSFTMPVKNPITVERVIPTFANNKMAIVGVMNTPWGSYDVAEDSVDLTIEGPDGQNVNPSKIATSGLSRSLAHGGHYAPVNQTWIWSYKNEPNLEPGTYTIKIGAENFQGSASAKCAGFFTIDENGNGELVPAGTEPGRCGFQSISGEEASELAEGAN
jgi:hypothetical protein